MKEYERPSVQTYGSVEALTRDVDPGYGKPI
jgi:hypothetical protein